MKNRLLSVYLVACLFLSMFSVGARAYSTLDELVVLENTISADKNKNIAAVVFGSCGILCTIAGAGLVSLITLSPIPATAASPAIYYSGKLLYTQSSQLDKKLKLLEDLRESINFLKEIGAYDIEITKNPVANMSSNLSINTMKILFELSGKDRSASAEEFIPLIKKIHVLDQKGMNNLVEKNITLSDKNLFTAMLRELGQTIEAIDKKDYSAEVVDGCPKKKFIELIKEYIIENLEK